MDESVEAHLVSDVPVAAFLSGGLDSSSVVASMAISGEAPHAFTARYRGAGADLPVAGWAGPSGPGVWSCPTAAVAGAAWGAQQPVLVRL